MRRDRLPDWPDRLLAAIAAQQMQPFVWGHADCATLFADCVQAITGEDPLAAYRPWHSPASAARAVFSAGCRDAADFVRMILPAIPPAAAGRGDFGYAAGPRDRLQFPAVIVGGEALSRNETGWVLFSRSLITEAYTIV